MADLVLLLTGISCVLAAAWFIADMLLRNRPEVQDLVWRASLVLVAGLPIAWLARTAVPQVVVQTPVELNFRTEPVEVVRREEKLRQGARPVTKPINIAEDASTFPTATVGLSEPSQGTQPVAKSFAEPVKEQTESMASSKASLPVSKLQWQAAFTAMMPIVAFIWFAGTLWSLTNLLRGAFRLSGLVRDSKEAEATWQLRLNRATALIGIRRAVQMRTSAKISSPLVAGLRNPVLLWPSRDNALFDEQSCDEMLIHELAHIRRGDLWTNVLLQITTALWWPHPMMHLMRTRIVWLREILCDAAVSQHGDRTHYAETLLQIATRPAATATSCGQLAIEPRGGTLEARITSVLQGTASRWSVPKWFTRITWATLVSVFLAVAAVQFLPTPASALTPTPFDGETAESKSETTKLRTVSGRVMSPDGQEPATEGTVYLLKNPVDYFTLPTKPLKAAVSGKGEFIFVNVEPAGYRIWAETNSLTSLKKKLGGQRVDVETKKASKPVTLVLHDACNFEVTVRSTATGSPVANAEITFGWTDIVRSYRTDAQGIARIGGLAANEWYFVIRADQYATSFKKIPSQPLGSTTPLTFDLQASGKVFGVVTTPDGVPVANAGVSASLVGPAMTPNLNRTQTDSAGKYELTNLPLNKRVRVSCSANEHEGDRQEIAVSKEARTLRYDFTLTPREYAGDALFTVVDEDGKVISAATLINQGNSSANVREGITNEMGECRLQKLYDGHRGVTVVAKAEGYVAQRVTVKPGTTESPALQTIRLQRGKRLLGRLLKPDRSPAVGVRVYYNQGEHGELEGGRVETNRNGLFEINGLPEKSLFTVYTPKGFAPIKDIPLPIGRSDSVDVVMQPEGVLVVQAVDAATGAPIPEYNVRVGFSRDRRTGDPTGSWMASSLSNPGQNILGATKQFRHGGFQPGFPLQVTVSAVGYERKVFPRIEAIAEADGKPLIAKLRRTVPSSLIKVAGRLLNDSGKPVEGAHVRLVVGSEDPFQPKSEWKFYRWDSLIRGDVAKTPQCLQFLSTTTDSTGRFTFDDVKDAPWLEIFHTSNDLAPTRHLDLRETSKQLSNLELLAISGGSVQIDFDVNAWPEAEEVQIYSAAQIHRSGNRIIAFGSTQGQIRPDSRDMEFAKLPPGNYTATITGKRIYNERGSFNRPRLHSMPFQVESGRTTTVKFK